MYQAGGSPRADTTVRLLSPSQGGIYGLREHLTAEIPKTGITLTARPHAVQAVSALDKVLLASHPGNFGT
eukprot:scaffold652043_cov48-Prasinocladus_malaysianus.AAC.1